MLWLFIFIGVSLKSYGAIYSNSPLMGGHSSLAFVRDSVAIHVVGLKCDFAKGKCSRGFSSIERILNAKLCSSTPFTEEPVLGIGTGFLVAPDKLAMAAHSVSGADFCKHTAFLFGFQQGLFDPSHIPLENVAFCKSVKIDQDLDVAIVELHQKMEDRHYFKTRGKIADAGMIQLTGHPLGLPLKTAMTDRILNEDKSHFYTTLSALFGNSGSPVYNSHTLELLGVLVAGQTDFEKQGSCTALKHCDEDLKNCSDWGFSGEKVVKVDNIEFDQLLDDKKSVVKTLFHNYKNEVLLRYGKELHLKFNDHPIEQMLGGFKRDGTPHIEVYQGMLDNYSPEEVVFAVCHELGHILGDVDFTDVPLDLRPEHLLKINKLEGEADYFAGKCLMDYLTRSNYSMDRSDRFDFYEYEGFNQNLAFKFANSHFDKLYKKETNVESALKENFEGINHAYPSKACRLLSAQNGILGLPRPACWYNPIKQEFQTILE